MKRDILWLIGILFVLVFALGGGLYFALVAERDFNSRDLNSTRLLVYIFVFVYLYIIMHIHIHGFSNLLFIFTYVFYYGRVESFLLT